MIRVVALAIVVALGGSTPPAPVDPIPARVGVAHAAQVPDVEPDQHRPSPGASSPSTSPAVLAGRSRVPTTDLRAVASVSGVASWYDWRLGQAAAGPELRSLLGPRWRGDLVQVCAQSRCIVVRLTDWCGCLGMRLVDLDARSFAFLTRTTAYPDGRLSLGLLRVIVNRD